MTPERWSDAAIHSDTHPYYPLFRGHPMTPMAAPWGKADRPPSRAQWRPDFWLLDAPPLFGPARVWESATPFVVTRHPKQRGRRKDPPDCHGISGRPQFAMRVLDEECQRWLRRQPTLAGAASPTYTVLEHVGRTGSFRPLQFRRVRRKPGDDGANRATAAFRLEFDRDVAGPLCLGHASHFGLGLFLQAD